MRLCASMRAYIKPRDEGEQDTKRERTLIHTYLNVYAFVRVCVACCEAECEQCKRKAKNTILIR